MTNHTENAIQDDITQENVTNNTIQDDITQENVTNEVTFESFNLKPELLKGLQDAGFKIPSPIQEKVIPLILAGSDVVAQAHTGTGKTAAFGLPAMSIIDGKSSFEILVITPTRELATQVSDELFRLGTHLGIKTVTVYGGRAVYQQVESIRRGGQIVVATPGRLLDLLSSNKLPNFKPSIVVLDEADEMLDMGFLEDIQKIFTYLPEERQTLLFSATMPLPIQNLAKKILKTPAFVSVTKKETTNSDIKQFYYVIDNHERDDAVIRLIDSEVPTKSIIFCRTRKEVDRLGILLVAGGYLARGLHGDMEQSQREEVIGLFRAGKVEVLIATDVAARGLNVVDVSHVFNYHIPFDPQSYVHRIGRTGRAGRKGVAITLVTPLEFRELQRISKTVGSKIEQSFIPTIKEVKTAKMSKLVEEIQRQPLNDEANFVLKALEEQIDLSQITFKLISLLLSKQSVSGPDQIGIGGQRLEKMLKQAQGGGGNNNDRGQRFDPTKRKPFRPGGQKRFGKSFSDGQERSFSDRPKRSFSDGQERTASDRPKRSFSDSPERPFSDKPKRSFSDGQERSFSDRPKRSFSDSPERPFSDKPKRSFSDGQERSFSDRPKRSFSDSPERPFSDRPKRTFSDKPKRTFSDKPQPRTRDDRQ